MDERWLKRTCRKWQKRLGLMDWTITAAFAPITDLTEGCTANISWEPDDMTAQMWVARPEDATDSSLYFIESCVVHELGHLLFYGHIPIPEYDVNMERALNKMTGALMPKRKHCEQ